MCGIFGCTLDDLVQGDLTNRAPASGSAEGAASAVPAGEMPGAFAGATGAPSASAPVGPCVAAAPSASPYAAVAGVGVPGVQQDVFGYDEHMRAFAWKIATGVLFIILGVAAAVLLGAGEPFLHVRASEAAGGIAVFAGVALGLAFIIPAGMEHTRFKKAHPFVMDFYTQEERDASSRALAWAITAGIALIFAGVGACMVLEEAGSEGLGGCAVLLGTAAGVWLFVRFGIMHSRLGLGEYANEATETLAQAHDRRTD